MCNCFSVRQFSTHKHKIVQLAKYGESNSKTEGTAWPSSTQFFKFDFFAPSPSIYGSLSKWVFRFFFQISLFFKWLLFCFVRWIEIITSLTFSSNSLNLPYIFKCWWKSWTHLLFFLPLPLYIKLPYYSIC